MVKQPVARSKSSKAQNITIRLSEESIVKALFGKSKKGDTLTNSSDGKVLSAKVSDYYWTKTVEPLLVKDYQSFRRVGLKTLVNEARDGGRYVDDTPIRGLGVVLHKPWDPLEDRYYKRKQFKSFRRYTGQTNKLLQAAVDTQGTTKGITRSKRISKKPRVRGTNVSLVVNYSYRYSAPTSNAALSEFLMGRYLAPDSTGSALHLTGPLKKLAFFENGTRTHSRRQEPRPLFDPVSRAYGFRRRNKLKKAF